MGMVCHVPHVCWQVHKIHRDLEEQLQINAQLLADNSQRQIDIQAKETEVANLKVRTAVGMQTTTRKPTSRKPTSRSSTSH